MAPILDSSEGFKSCLESYLLKFLREYIEGLLEETRWEWEVPGVNEQREELNVLFIGPRFEDVGAFVTFVGRNNKDMQGFRFNCYGLEKLEDLPRDNRLEDVLVKYLRGRKYDAAKDYGYLALLRIAKTDAFDLIIIRRPHVSAIIDEVKEIVLKSLDNLAEGGLLFITLQMDSEIKPFEREILQYLDSNGIKILANGETPCKDIGWANEPYAVVIQKPPPRK